MVRFSFNVREDDAERIYALLQEYEVENLVTDIDNPVSKNEIQVALEGLEDFKNGRFHSSSEVQKEADNICGH